MGVKATLGHSNVLHDTSDSALADHDPRPSSKAGCPTSSSRAVEKQCSQRRKVDSVLDDIMGDPDDFRDLADSDAESDGGQWEDAVRAAHGHEGAGVEAVHPEIRDSEGGLSKVSGEANLKQNGTVDGQFSRPVVSPSPTRDTVNLGSCGGGSGQNGPRQEQKADESERRKHLPNPLAVVSTCSEGSRVHSRFFIIKSLNHHNIAKSIEKGIWATQAMNEPVLNEAFETAERVLLVFSVNMSGHFQGYAQMTSPIGRRRANVWSEANEGANPWGGTFSVDWLRLHDLPFQRTVHLKNPLNSFKPVKISRDCQELTEDVGFALCALIDEGADRDGRPKRKVTSADLAAFSSKRKRKELLGVPNDGSQCRLQMGGGPNGACFPTVHPQLHPEVANEPLSSSRPSCRLPGRFSSHVSYPVDAHKVQKSKSPHLSEKSLGQGREHERENRHRERERPFERDRARDCTRSSSTGHTTDLPVEEDLLNMTYEEYLRRHGNSREFNTGYDQGAGPFSYNLSSPSYGGSWMGRNAGMGFPEDQYSNYITSWYSSQGPPMGRDRLYSPNGIGNTHTMRGQPDTRRLGHAENVREHRPVRAADAKPRPRYSDHYGISSRKIERITEASS